MKNQSKQAQKPQSVIMPTPVPALEADRRLRPVMTALYSRNSKQALKLVNQAIQKRPGWPAARALRACIYIQTERWTDAEDEMAILRNDLVTARVPINEDAAKKMHLYYQEIRREDIAGEMYESVWKLDVSDIRMAEMAFCLYVRGNAFSNAQKLATKMHRCVAATTQKYAFWATAALWLTVTYEARSSVAEVSQMDNRMLKLGCAMMSKALEASSVAPTAETVRFATRVFKQSAEYESAINLISHPRLVMDDAEVLHLRADVRFAATKDASDYQHLLSSFSPNDWGYWLHYFECVKEADNWIENAKVFVERIIHNVRGEKEPHRGPYLARMELLYRDGDWNALVQNVTDYFDQFGDKTVVSRDLRPWIALLEEHNLHDTTLEKIDEIAEGRGFPHTLHAFWLQLWFDRLEEKPERLVERYRAEKIEGLEATDRQPGDDYLILAAHKILPPMNTISRYENAPAVLKAVMMLEGGLNGSPFNHDIKLLLIRLYTAIGGMERVSELWDSLDVKHVQLSTLTHIVLNPFYETGHHGHLRNVLENVNMLWREIDREIPECTTRAFLEGSLNAAVDFVLFKLRLERSAVLAEAMVIDSQLNLIMSDGEPHGAQQALSLLTVQPRFTVEDFSGTKRIVTNEDNLCYRFWDYAGYDKDRRLDSLRDEFLEEGVTCAASRVATLSKSLESSMALLQLSVDNGQTEGGQAGASSETKLSLQETASNDRDDGVSADVKLRLEVARNLVDVKLLLCKVMAATDTQHANGTGGNTHPTEMELALNRATELSEKVSERVKNVLESRNEKIGKNDLTFPTKVRECGKVVYDLLLVVAVSVSSFSPVLTKGQRRMKKSGGKGEAKASEAMEGFERGRKAVMMYRDALMSAACMISNWVTPIIDQELDWSGRLYESDGIEDDLCQLLPDELRYVNLFDATAPLSDRPISRAEFCNQIVDSIRSSHFISCTSLLKTLTAITQRLHLADL